MKIALQVYSVREDAERDFKGTLAAIKAMGYDGVEFAGLYDTKPETIRAWLDELGLEAMSAHIPVDAFLEDCAGTIAAYKTLGCTYVAIPWLDEARRPGNPGFDVLVGQLEDIGRQCADAGLTLLYHNHDFEFARLSDGRYALDAIYETIPAQYLQTEIDTCWVNVAGEDPAAYVRKYTGRAPVVHLKDFVMHGRARPEQMYALIDEKGADDAKVDAGESFDFRPVGYGVQDMKAICQASVDAGASWMVVEQDRSSERPAQEAAHMSRDYLKSIGY